MRITRDGSELPAISPRAPEKAAVRVATTAALAASVYLAGTRTAIATSYGTVVASGTAPPTVTLSGTPTVGGTIRIEITLGGARGTAMFKWSVNGGSFTTGETTGASVALGSTGVSAAFAVGLYSADNVYTAAGDYTTLAAVDGVTLVVGDRLLDKNHATATRRGWYDVIDLGSTTTPWILRRSSDADSSDKIVPGVITEVLEGSVNGDKLATLTTDATITLDSTSLAWSLASATDVASDIVLGSDAQGDVYYRGASSLSRLAAGAIAGMVLLTGGPSANPSWGTVILGATGASGAPGTAGAAASITGGTGGAGTGGAGAGGAGGATSLVSGQGGAGTAAGAAGAGGTLAITAGNGGTSNGVGGAGGSVILTCGRKTGSAAEGTFSLIVAGSTALSTSTTGGILFGAASVDPGLGGASLGNAKFIRGEYTSAGYNLIGVDASADVVVGNTSLGIKLTGSGQVRFVSTTNSYAWQSASVIIGLLTATQLQLGADDNTTVAGNFAIRGADITTSNTAAKLFDLYAPLGNGTGAAGYVGIFGGIVGSSGVQHTRQAIARFYGTGVTVVAGGGALTHASTIFDVQSTTQGVTFPRMTTTQRDAISSPTEGLVVYNTSTHVLNFHNGTAWGAV